MANYTCDKCGMAVNITCDKCNETLVDDTLTTDDGTQVHVSRCPKCDGKIIAPQCCGADMSCSTS